MPVLPEPGAGCGPPGHVRGPCNAGLQQRIEAWRRHGVSLRCTDQANGLKAVRDAVPDLAGYGFSAGQQVLRRLDKDFAALFHRVKAGEAPGFPRFRSADSRRRRFRLPGGAAAPNLTRERPFQLPGVKPNQNLPIGAPA